MSGSITSALVMDEDKEKSPSSGFRRAPPGWWAVPALLLSLYAASATGMPPPADIPQRHFKLEAGDAAVMLNEFSRQADLQVLFDFNVLRGLKTRSVTGDLTAPVALTSMLGGTDLVFDFVNDRTLAVTLVRKKPGVLRRLWRHVSSGPRHPPPADGLEQVLVSGAFDDGTQPLLGAQTIALTRAEIDRSGFATAQDFLRTLPQVFGGGPSEDTLLVGREANTNSARGAGVNLRGLNAGATLVLIDGLRAAPSGTEGTFVDISNIPLSAVDHIDVLPDGASARYGADAIGGVVNFVMRNNFTGSQTQARTGGVTDGSLGEHQVSQILGTKWDAGRATLSFEYYERDALREQDRRQAGSDLTQFGGTDFDTPYGNPGTITDGINYWPLPKGQNGTGLVGSHLVAGNPNLFDQYKNSDITPREARWSAFGRASQQVGDDLSLFVEGLFTKRNISNIASAGLPLVLSVPATNPFYVNPAGGTDPVTVLYGSGADFGPPLEQDTINTGNVAFGAAFSLSQGWSVMGHLGYTFEKQHELLHGLVDQGALAAALADPDTATAFNPFADGSNTNPATLAAIEKTGVFDLNSTVKSIDLTGSGPLLPLPGGDVHLSLGAEYRSQAFDTLITGPDDPSGYDPYSALGRRTAAAFAEIAIPLIGADNSNRVAKRLELSLGTRYEHITAIGGASAPKAGFRWSPRSNLNIRGTWTKSFRAPNLPDMTVQNSYSQQLVFADSTSPTGTSNALVRYGTNPDLQVERARSWTLGADFAPAAIQGLSVSFSYFNVAYQGRIDEALIGSDVLERPDLSWLVNRNFTAAELTAACSTGTFVGAPGSCLGTPVTAIIDNRLRNIALLRTRGVDLIGKYAFNSPLGRFEMGLNGTYLLEYSQSNTPTGPLLDILDTANNPIDLRLRGSFSWERRGLAIATFTNFDNSYRDTLSVPNRKVSSLTTLDVQVSYETNGAIPNWFGPLRFAVSARNVFDTYPPFLNNPIGVGYDQENADLIGRVVSFEISKRW